MTQAAISAEIATNDSISIPPYPIGRTWLSFITIFGVVPDLITMAKCLTSAYVQLGETDEWAHARRYDCYLEAAYNSDRFVRKLWETVQSMPDVSPPALAIRPLSTNRRPRRSSTSGNSFANASQ